MYNAGFKEAIIENAGILLKGAIQVMKAQAGRPPQLQITEMEKSEEEKNEEMPKD